MRGPLEKPGLGPWLLASRYIASMYSGLRTHCQTVPNCLLLSLLDFNLAEEPCREPGAKTRDYR